MSAVRSLTYDRSARGPDRSARRVRRLLVGSLVGVAALALPTSPAFGEGSVNVNIGPSGTSNRHSLSVANPTGAGTYRSPLSVYAQAGETVQMASSLMGLPGANIRIFAPGADPESAPPLLDCVVAQPLSGRIDNRAAELAGPAPNGNPDAYDACDFTVPADGVYTVIMYGTSSANGSHGTVDTPLTDASQGYNASMWDVTVRDAGGAVRPGRVFAPKLQFRTSCVPDPTSNVQTYVYSKTGYEYQVNFYDHAGCNWIMTSDDRGVVDASTGDRIFASFACGNDQVGNNACQYNNAQPAADYGQTPGPLSLADQYPLFVSRVDPLTISGPGGLAALHGYSTTPISPAANPLAGATFTGSQAQAGATKRGEGGTIGFTSPTAMAELGYTVAIDTNRDGTFGNGSDFVDDTSELSATGTNSFTWNGRDSQANVPACGDYQYQVRSTLSEVHFTQVDTENSGGMRFERLSLPTDATLGNVLAASYDNRDPYKGGYVVTNNPVSNVTDGISGPGFNAWSNTSGNTDYIDTWARLPEVATTGTLRLLCADVQIIKGGRTGGMVPGQRYTYTLDVKNNGPDTATNVVATDVLPRELTFSSASTGCTNAGGTVTCTVPTLAVGSTHRFEITVDVPSSLKQCLNNTGRVTNDTPDPNLTNNESTNCPPPDPKTNLTMAKTASSPQVSSGGQVMYTLVVKNNGPSDAEGVKVTDPMAAGLALVSAQPSQGTCSTTGGQVLCTIGDLEAGGSAQVLVTATVTAPPGSCGASAINNRATTTSDNEETNSSDNTASAQICTTPPLPSPPYDLVVTKTASDRSILVGERVTYRVVVRNNGPATASNVRLTDTLNAPVTVVSVRSTQGRCERQIPMGCQLGTIAAGRSVTITIVAKHLQPGNGQRNAASATGDGTDSNPSNNLDTVDVNVSRIRLQLTKVASREVVRGGQTFSYAIRVRNPTKGEARDVKVCDRLPSGLRYVSSSPRAKVSGRQQCWTIKLLAAGKSRTFRITVRAASGASGRKTNTATVTSPDVRTVRARDAVRLVPLADRPTG